MLSGKTPEANEVRGNADMNAKPRQLTYDRVLLANGWHGEWTGKFHSPYNYTRDDNGTSYYSRYVHWLNGGSKPLYPPAGLQSMCDTYRGILDQAEPLQLLEPGQLLDKMYQRAYFPDIADARYAQASNETLRALSNALIKSGHANQVPTTSQQDVNGRLAMKTNHSYAALTFAAGMSALERLKKTLPFTLTVSVEAPHPPFISPAPFYDMYSANGSIPTPLSKFDPKSASPYHDPHNPSGDEGQVRQQSSNYYGMIAQNDDLVGALLRKLDALQLSATTLVVYLADHGEMLGDHGMQSKMVFYEGAVHIPLIMRLPGAIPAGTVVRAPVSNLALFGTITDYLGVAGHAPRTSQSLRPLIEGAVTGAGADAGAAGDTDRVVFSFWDTDVAPGYMATDGRFKLMIGREAKPRLVDGRGVGLVDVQGFDAPGVDALYDLAYDPGEQINLLRSPFVKKHLSELHPDIAPGSKEDLVPFEQVTRLQAALTTWLRDSGSQYAAGVQMRRPDTAHINQAPVLAKPVQDVTWSAKQPNALAVPNGTFVDVDGDELHFTGLLDRKALPGWLTVGSDSGALHGTPPAAGTHLVRLVASDPTGPAFVEFLITVV
jgi:arylsulfatase A-like enzyme